MTYLVATSRDARPAGDRFRDMLKGPGILRMPGAFNGLAALQAKQAGFKALYLSGAAMSASMGLPSSSGKSAERLIFPSWWTAIRDSVAF
jgi:methylisocitrate lyase